MKVGTVLSRVHCNKRGSVEFNPGPGADGRFSFFGVPPVPVLYMPVLYAAEIDTAAVAETLLRNIPAAGGVLTQSQFRDNVLSEITATRRVTLASFLGTGLWVLGVTATQLTDTPGVDYPQARK